MTDFSSAEGSAPGPVGSGGASRSIVVGVEVQGRRLRLHISGETAAIRAVLEQLHAEASLAEDEDAFLASAGRLLAEHHVQLLDVLDLMPAAADVFRTLFDQVGRQQSADRAWTVLWALMQSATNDDLDKLVAAGSLQRSRSIIQSVLDDLDERSEWARRQLAEALAAPYAYLLVE